MLHVIKLSGDLAAFNGLDKTVEKYVEEIEQLKKIQQKMKNTIHFYFEFFGKGILNRVNYGPDKYLRLINIRYGTEMLAPKEVYEIVEENNLQHILVPVLGYTNGLEEALNAPDTFNTTLNPIEGNVAEGVVIKPFNKVLISPVGEIFLLKKKNEKFKEKDKSIKVKKEKQIDPELAEYHESFSEYITESRMYGIFSKEGRTIQKPSEIGYFISKFIEDAKKDWYKDNEDVTLNKKDERIVFNVGPRISKMLLKVIQDQ